MENMIDFNAFVNECLKIEKNIENVRKEFLLGEFSEGMTKLLEVFNGVDNIINFIKSSNDLKKISSNCEGLFCKISILEKAMEIPDYILISDLLRYEIKPVIKNYRIDVEKIRLIQ